MNREEEYEFYAQPENQAPQGPGRRRKAAMTAMVPVRLPEETLETIRELAEKQDRSVSSWIRQAVKNEIDRQGLAPINRDVHVVPTRSGGWEVVASDREQPGQATDSHAAAVKRARAIVRNRGGGEVIIHRRNDRIRDSVRIRQVKDPKPL